MPSWIRIWHWSWEPATFFFFPSFPSPPLIPYVYMKPKYTRFDDRYPRCDLGNHFDLRVIMTSSLGVSELYFFSMLFCSSFSIPFSIPPPLFFLDNSPLFLYLFLYHLTASRLVNDTSGGIIVHEWLSFTSLNLSQESSHGSDAHNVCSWSGLLPTRSYGAVNLFTAMST